MVAVLGSLTSIRSRFLGMLGVVALFAAPAFAAAEEPEQQQTQEPSAAAPLAPQLQASAMYPGVRRAASLRPGADRLPAIRSEFVLVVDQDTDEVLMQKNPGEISSIASITKLMTAMVTIDLELPLEEDLQVSREDRTTAGWTGSSLRPGVRLTRAEALHLALMSSENHAAQMLGRTYPGGVEALVAAMNAKARVLGMNDTNFVDPTGLSPQNRSSPSDLVLLVKAAYEYPQIREFSVSTEYNLPVGKRHVRYQNTNRLTSHADWQIGLQKTGFNNAAGRCLVMQAVIEGRRVVMILLDSIGRYSRFADAQRIHDWLIARASAEKTAALD